MFYNEILYTLQCDEGTRRVPNEVEEGWEGSRLGPVPRGKPGNTCTHTYTHTCTHTCTHNDMYTHMHTRAHAHMHTHMHTCMHTHTCTHTCTHIHTHVHTTHIHTPHTHTHHTHTHHTHTHTTHTHTPTYTHHTHTPTHTIHTTSHTHNRQKDRHLLGKIEAPLSQRLHHGHEECSSVATRIAPHTSSVHTLGTPLGGLSHRRERKMEHTCTMEAILNNDSAKKKDHCGCGCGCGCG